MHKGLDQKIEVRLPEGFLWVAYTGAVGWVWGLGMRRRSVVPPSPSGGEGSQASHKMFATVSGARTGPENNACANILPTI